MIRFGVVLSVVLIAIGLLVTGVVAGSLLLVAISIGVAVLAFLLLIGVVISSRHEIFGRGVADGAVPTSPVPASTVPASAVLPSGVPRQEAAEGVALYGTAADTRGGVAAAARAATPRQGSDYQGRARPAAPAAVAAASTGAPGTRGTREAPGTAGTPEAPGTAGTPGTRVKVGDGRQKATGVKTKEPGTEPVTQGSRRAETPAVVTAGQDKPAGDAAPGTAAAGAASTARSDRSGTAAAGAASTARSDRSGKDRPATEPAAPSKDRPGSVTAERQDRAEPHRASRLERESARAAVAKAAASSAAGSNAAGSAAGDRPAAATAGSPPEVGRAGGQPAAKARPARDNDQRQQEEAAAGAQGGVIKTKPEPAAAAAGGTGGDRKPTKPAEPDRDTLATAAGPEAGEQSASADSAQVTVIPGITRYHRSDCLLIRFLSADDIEVMTRRAATESGCLPCKACKPDLQS